MHTVMEFSGPSAGMVASLTFSRGSSDQDQPHRSPAFKHSLPDGYQEVFSPAINTQDLLFPKTISGRP